MLLFVSPCGEYGCDEYDYGYYPDEICEVHRSSMFLIRKYATPPTNRTRSPREIRSMMSSIEQIYDKHFNPPNVGDKYFILTWGVDASHPRPPQRYRIYLTLPNIVNNFSQETSPTEEPLVV